jgi:hypothetical protein
MDEASINFMTSITIEKQRKADWCPYHDENSNHPSKQPTYRGNADTRIGKQAIARFNIKLIKYAISAYI